MKSNQRNQSSASLGVPNPQAPIPFPSSEYKYTASRYPDDIDPIQHLANSAAAILNGLPDSGDADEDGELSNKRKAMVLQPKRPVGRPRLYPKKELDPNRIRRVPKGDKPLGRPRTAHLKPPKVKRPRGRPRKDAASLEAIGAVPQKPSADTSFRNLLATAIAAATTDGSGAGSTGGSAGGSGRVVGGSGGTSSAALGTSSGVSSAGVGGGVSDGGSSRGYAGNSSSSGSSSGSSSVSSSNSSRNSLILSPAEDLIRTIDTVCKK